jgi:hypothetical protein
MIAFIICTGILLTIFFLAGKIAWAKQDRNRASILSMLKDCPELPDIINRYDALLKEARTVYRRVADDSPHDIILFHMLKEAHSKNENPQEW